MLCKKEKEMGELEVLAEQKVGESEGRQTGDGAAEKVSFPPEPVS